MNPEGLRAPELLAEDRLRKAVALEVDGAIGLEVGGPTGLFEPSGPIPIYALAERLDNCNFQSWTVWGPEFVEGPTFAFAQDKKPGYQYIGEASDLSRLASSSYDFVCSSHTLEHCANPVKALREWARVLKPNGHLLIILPHKDGTFDHRRPVTRLSHLIEDERNCVDEHDLTHLPEILALHDLAMDPPSGTPAEFRDRSMLNYENRCLHQHVFDTALVVSLLDHCGFRILSVNQFLPFHIVAFAQICELGIAPDNSPFKRRRASCYANSPFPSDRQRCNHPFGWLSRFVK
jgi:SAM-dependent methyltransferase